MADALTLGMMPTLIETPECGHGPHCTRAQAQRLLEELRSAYQTLSMAQRSLVKSAVSQFERAQYALEMD